MFRFYPTRGFPFYVRPVRIEAEVGMTNALVGQFLHTETFGLNVPPTASSRLANGT